MNGWKTKKHGAEKRCLWRKPHLVVDADTHQIVSAEISLSMVTDSEVLSELLRKTHRKIKTILGDGAYYIWLCYQAIECKKAKPLILPRVGAVYWKNKYPRNQAVACQRIYGITLGQYRRLKRLFGSSLSLRDYDGQVDEAYIASCFK